MMQGRVNDKLEAKLWLTVFGSEGDSQRIHCIVDTGFDGEVGLPADVAKGLELQFAGTCVASVADGSVIEVESYSAFILWREMSSMWWLLKPAVDHWSAWNCSQDTG